MRLGSILKLGSIIRAKVYEAVNAPDNRRKAYGSKGLLAPESDHAVEQTAVILDEKARQVRISCWNCGHSQWVACGSKCHHTGLCGNCVQLIDHCVRSIDPGCTLDDAHYSMMSTRRIGSRYDRPV